MKWLDDTSSMEKLLHDLLRVISREELGSVKD